MITEDRQGEALGRWLSAGGDPPDDVDFDALEGCYALRPDLAPAPTTTIEEIWSHVDQARATAAIVDGQPGGAVDADVREGLYALRPDLAPAPTTTIEEIWRHVDEAPAVARGDLANVDPDVAQAVYALRPELAPAPTVSIDDILGRVVTGPLAKPQAGAEVIAFPARPVVAPKPAQRQRSWGRVLAGGGAVGGVSVLAAAAAIALFVLPNLSGTDLLDGPAASYDEAPAAKIAVDGSGMDATKGREEGEAPVAAEPIPEIAAVADAPLAKSPAKSPAMLAPAPKTAAPAAQAGPADLVAPVVATAPVTADSREQDDAVVDGFLDGDAEDADKQDYWATQPGAASGGEALGSRADAPVEESERRDRPARIVRGGASNMAEPSPPPMAPPVSTTATTTTESKSTAAKDNAPQPSAPGLRGAEASVVEHFGGLEATAKAHAAAGRYDDAARALLPAIVAPRDVGQYYAAMSAEWFLDANDVVGARDAVDRGYALGTPVRSELSRVAAALGRLEAPMPAPATESSHQ